MCCVIVMSLVLLLFILWITVNAPICVLLHLVCSVWTFQCNKVIVFFICWVIASSH